MKSFLVKLFDRGSIVLSLIAYPILAFWWSRMMRIVARTDLRAEAMSFGFCVYGAVGCAAAAALCGVGYMIHANGVESHSVLATVGLLLVYAIGGLKTLNLIVEMHNRGVYRWRRTIRSTP